MKCEVFFLVFIYKYYQNLKRGFGAINGSETQYLYALHCMEQYTALKLW